MSNENETQLTLTVGWAKQLLANPSPAMRESAAAAVATELETGTLSASERRIAFDIVEMLARDVAQQVREALAEHVKSSSLLPRAVALKLAQDVETVAVPVIQHSKILTDDDLIALVRGGVEAKQVAVAMRETVAGKVTAVLADTENRTVVGTMLANQGAELSEDTYARVLDSFEDDEMIQTLMVKRPKLPIAATERLINHISHELRDRLIQHHDLPEEFAEELVMHGRERALTQAVASADDVAGTEQLVATLFTKGTLTPTLVLRALCEGDLQFLEIAMAKLANVPTENASLFMFDANRRVFEEFYEKTRLPKALFHAFRVGIDAANQLKQHQSNEPPADNARTDYTRHLIDQLVNIYNDVCPQELEHVLSQLSRQVINQPEQR